MGFSINFIDYKSPDKFLTRGQISIGDFAEEFECAIHYWNKEKYINQWLEGCNKICEESKSALMTSIHEPKKANFMVWWVMHREKNIIYIQNHLLMMEGLLSPFVEENIYEHIRDRETIDEDGNEISEWQTTVSEVQEWLQYQKLKNSSEDT